MKDQLKKMKSKKRGSTSSSSSVEDVIQMINSEAQKTMKQENSSKISALTPQDVLDMSLESKNQLAVFKGEESLYPANLVMEGHEQHSRWFLTSFLSSMIFNR
jgi:isoleucyl-tRNA synthetase